MANTIDFTRDELQVVFQALCLAEAYYLDSDRRVKGMAEPTGNLIAERLNGIRPLLDRITRYAVVLR